VRAVKVDGRSWAFVAEPLRAIADLVYMRKDVSWERDGPLFLTESLRIEREDLENMNFESLDEICRSLRDRRTVDYLISLAREAGR